MTLVLTVVALLVVVMLGLVGYWRDTRRGVLALAGTLLGAILVEFWGQPWGQELARRLGGDLRALTFVASCVLLLFAVLFVGYGAGLLLGRATARPTFPRRLANLLLGMLNGALIVGYVLRFATNQNPGFAQTVRTTPLARAFHDGLPLLFLTLTIAVAVLVVLRGLVRLLGYVRLARTQTTKEPRSQPPAPSPKPPA